MFRKCLQINYVVGYSSTTVTTRHNLSTKFEAIIICTECHIISNTPLIYHFSEPALGICSSWHIQTHNIIGNSAVNG